MKHQRFRSDGNLNCYVWAAILKHRERRDGAVVRALDCHQYIWRGLDSQTWRDMWVEYVGSLLYSERFSPGFFPLLKTNL